MSFTAVGGVMLQAGCDGALAAETVWRIGFSSVFLPINQAILVLFSVLQ
jgi:hypothetical protein